MVPAFSDDFYNRIHISPNPVQFGSVLDTTTVTLEIWNAFFDTTTISSYVVQGFAGIELDPLQIPPPDVAILPLQNYNLTITATTDGPGVILGKLQFYAGEKYFPLITVTGRRAKLFPFVTSWDRDIIDAYEWKTNILETEQWDERRYKVRKYPRRSLQLGVAASGIFSGELRVALQSSQAADYGLPLWQYEGYLTADVAPGAAAIMVDTTDNDFRTGGEALIMESYLRFETVRIEEVQSDRLILQTEGLPGQAWYRGNQIFPVRIGSLDPEIQFTHPAGNVSRAIVNFDVTAPEKEFLAHGFATYLGYPVVPWMPNWRDGRKYSCTRKMEVVDGGIYQAERYIKGYRFGETYSFEWFLNGRPAVKKFLGMANYLCGRFRPIWVPSWQEDMRIRKNYVINDEALSVTGNFASKMAKSNVAKPMHLRVKLKNGAEYYDRILNASPDPTSSYNDVITLAGGIAGSFTVNEVENLCLMPLCRLAEDTVIVTWLSATMAEATTTFVYVPEQPE